MTLAYISPFTVQLRGNRELLIRTAASHDGKAMHQLTKDVVSEEAGLIMTMEDYFLSVEEEMRRNEVFLQHPQTIAIIAEHEKKLIAILTIEPEPLLKTAHRGSLGIIIHRDYRSQGIGKILMNTAIQWAKNNIYYEKLELEVLQSNVPGISLYEKVGFVHEGIIQDAVKHRENNYENLLKMGLLLS